MTQTKVLGRCSKRHRHQEFLDFLRQIDLEYPAGEIHIIMDNYGTHKQEKVKKWFARRKRYHLHFTPTSASWLNQVETWFSILTRQRIRRGSYNSEKELQQAIYDYIKDWNEHPVPFKWVKTAAEAVRKYMVAN